ncbi:bifunctional (p)ppGpp synthetase/guanosine-3',5'-bis(diphosphate) 3'-pyrophosphohydrolase, partial [Candidatus Uhrbacteria bacterium]|nr:bifunctional (p)ppGpp synthetase/guanosine-3',5'-bis(diphosphate) 3'-pyrophosphohydrolase [Candidatus Uhrbacteria bacterium]
MTPPKEKLWSFEDLEHALKTHYETPDIARVRAAYEYAKEAHGDKKRYTGAPYIIHPIATAVRLAEMSLPIEVVIAGLLHDVPEDTSRTLADVRDAFGADVATLVAGVTKLGKVKYRGIERYAENLRKMFLAMASDVRVVFIKFCDRLHNVETLFAMPEAKRMRVAKEVLEIYAPIAGRLGMGDMKGKLEDNAFRYTSPEDYQKAKKLFKEQVSARKTDLENTIHETENKMKQAHIPVVTITGRKKFLYSFWKKLERYHGDISRVYDLIAIRLIVDSIADCYAALGVLHSHWTPLKGRIKDYISQPKPNGYQSLHTTVFDERCGIIEFQIRTQSMHEEAEFGVAAHWHYKQTGDERPRPMIPWMQDLVNLHKEISTGKDFMKHLDEVKLDMFQD